MVYIENTNKEENCVFCTEPARPECDDNLMVYRGQRAYVILNRYPYTSGHVMVVSVDHRSSLEDLDAEVRAEMMELATVCMRIIRKVYQPEGFNMGSNIGGPAGAGVAEHVHIHIVPRWTGDTSFMTTVGNARVLPEELEETYHRLQEAWNHLA